jgi:Tfp pilus assembly protein PilF
MADRYTYLPHVGLFVAIVWGLADAVRVVKMPRNVVAMGTSVTLLGLAILTIAQLGYWQDSTTLFTHALSINPTNYLAHHQLANELARGDHLDLAGAEHHYRAALASYPAHPRSHLNLGRVLARRGRWRGAENEVNEALRLDPALPGAADTLAEIQRRLRAASQPATRAATSTFSGPPPPL